jgi:hypothetical protein
MMTRSATNKQLLRLILDPLLPKNARSCLYAVWRPPQKPYVTLDALAVVCVLPVWMRQLIQAVIFAFWLD